jgi:hypothetical protein
LEQEQRKKEEEKARLEEEARLKKLEQVLLYLILCIYFFSF